MPRQAGSCRLSQTLGVIESMLSATLQNALIASGFAGKYYELCATHPIRNSPSQKCSNAEILAMLAALGNVSKLKGPGRIYEITAPKLLESVDFAFSIQGAGAVIEPCLGLTENGIRSGTNYAVLAFTASAEAKLPTPTPAYPRPYFHSLAELKEVVSAAFELSILVGNEVHRP